MSSNGERGFLAQVEARYKQTQALEKKALSLLKVKSPFDADVRVLRDSIRDNYEAILLSDYDFAAANDVELSLWSLHYRRIMEFRQRINAKATAVPIAETSGQRTTQKVRADSNKIAMQKLCAVFRSFLAEASGFYHNLIYKLRAKYGLPQDFSGFLKPEVSGSWSTCQKSCHRCLIYLGDLARYKELHGDSEGRNQDWTVAAGYYLQAAAVWPAGGNPHNQLAVLASYVNDELLSAYHYFRSLAVEIPFLTARDNLIMQFEKNRQRFLQLTPATGKEMRRRGNSMRVGQGLERGMGTIGDGAMRLAVKNKLDGKSTRPEGVVDYSDVQKSFNVRFVRLNGILFTKTSLETFSEVYASTLAELEQLLTMDDDQLHTKFGALHKGMGSGGGGSSRFLQFVVMLIFTIENISWMPDTQQPSYVEILQRSLLYQHAFTVAFEFCGQLLSRCKTSVDPKKCPVFPALLVFLEWLSCHPGVVIGSDVGQQQANARAFFWEQMVGLLNNIIEREGGWNGGLADYSASSVLWEDHELRGFQPIAKIQVSMDFSEPVTQADMWGDSQSQMRVRRFIEAAIAVASAAEETGGSSAVGIGAMIWKQDAGKFQLPGVALDLSSPEVQQAVEAPPDLDALVVNGLDHGLLNHDYTGISKELERLEVGEGPLTVGEGQGPGGQSPVNGNMKELVPVGAEWLVGEDDALGSWETPLEGEGSGYVGEVTDGPSDGEEEYEEVEEEGANLLEPEEEEVIVFRPVQNRQPLTGHQHDASKAVAAAMTTTATSSHVNTGNDMRSAAERRDVWPSGIYEPVQHEMSSPWSSGILPGFSVPYSVAVHENIASKQSSVPQLSTIRPSGYSMAMGGVASPGGWIGDQESPENTVNQGQSRPSMPSFGAWLPGTGTTTSDALSTKGDGVSTGVIGQPKRNVATSAVLSDVAQISKPYVPVEAGSGFFGSRRVQVDIPVPKPLHSNPPPSDYFGSASALTPGHLGTTPAPYSSSSSFWATSVGQHRDSIGAGWKLGVNGTGSEVDGVSEEATEMAAYGGGGSINTPSSSNTLQEAWLAMQSYGNAGSNLAAYGGATTLANNSKAPSVGVIGMQKVVKGGKPVPGPMSSQIWERDPHQMGAPSGILKDFAGSQDDYGWLDEFSQSMQLSSRSMQGHGQQLQQLPEDQQASMKLQGNGSSLWSTPVTRERVGGNLPLYPGMTRGSDNLSRDPFVS